MSSKKTKPKFKRMKQVEIKPNMTVLELIESMQEGGFTCRRVARATDLWFDMVQDEKCTKFIGLAGALIPGGMRKILTKLIENDLVDCIVTTGANVSHDVMESFGGEHLHGDQGYPDEKLAELGISRIYTTLVPYESFQKFETIMQSILGQINETKMSSREFIGKIGEFITDKDSFVRAAAERDIPIFSPSFADSMLGVQTWLFSQTHKFMIDVLKDHTEFSNIVYDSQRMGAIILGGGVPKHFILNASQLNDGLAYGIQITMDRPEHGGVSGASMKEGISWGKLSDKARWIDIMADVTLVLPLMTSALLSRINNQEGYE